MKKNQHLIVILGLLAFGCQKKMERPVAGFSFGQPIGGLSLTLTDTVFVIGTNDALIASNTSLNADSVRWDLGDGAISSSDRVILAYQHPGVYKVTLTAYNKGG